jgi:hypothetical protein
VPAPSPNLLDGLSSCVALARGTSPDGKPRVGTGFFVAASESRLYVVTASHVARTLVSGSELIVRTSRDRPQTFRLSDLAGANPAWESSGEADLAILPLKPRKDLQPLLKGHFLPLSMIERELVAPLREVTLTVLGFPLGLGAEGSFSPISRETRAASGLLTSRRPEADKLETFFLTQDPSVGGFSGAPVLDLKAEPIWLSQNQMQMRAGGPMVAGVAVGTISDDTGGKLGAIVPGYYVARLLDRMGESLNQGLPLVRDPPKN